MYSSRQNEISSRAFFTELATKQAHIVDSTLIQRHGVEFMLSQYCVPAGNSLHARIQTVLSEGVQHDEGREGQTGHHRPASETPFKWRFAGEPMIIPH